MRFLQAKNRFNSSCNQRWLLCKTHFFWRICIAFYRFVLVKWGMSGLTHFSLSNAHCPLFLKKRSNNWQIATLDQQWRMGQRLVSSQFSDDEMLWAEISKQRSWSISSDLPFYFGLPISSHNPNTESERLWDFYFFRGRVWHIVAYPPVIKHGNGRYTIQFGDFPMKNPIISLDFRRFKAAQKIQAPLTQPCSLGVRRWGPTLSQACPWRALQEEGRHLKLATDAVLFPGSCCVNYT